MGARGGVYDPFERGPWQARLRELPAHDATRDRTFPCDVWSPASSSREPRPLIIFSHHSGGNRRSATFFCQHLASHGYVAAAMDYSEVVEHELAPRQAASGADRAARIEAIIASRVPDLRFLLDYPLKVMATELDAGRIGLAGHSFGGWAVLAAPDVEPRVCSVIAMAPGGSRERRPGLLPLELAFAWGRDVPTLYLAAEDDVMTTLAGVHELYERTPGTKRLFVVRRADHEHFLDDVEAAHEAVRETVFSEEAAWIPAAMRPIEQLTSGEQAHTFVRGLALAHFDATLRGVEAAHRFLSRYAVAELARRGIDASAG